MPLWDTIRPYKSRQRFVVDGKWQGKRYRFAQIPVHTGFISCVSKEMAFELQKMLSAEIDAAFLTRPAINQTSLCILRLIVTNG